MQTEETATDQLYQIAIHEAGHAVVSAYYGIKFKDVSIKSRGNTAGRLKPWPAKKLNGLISQIQGINTGKAWHPTTIERKVKREIYVLYAGYASQLKTGTDNTEGAASDFEQISNFGMAYKDPGEDLDNFLKECLEDTSKIVDKNWLRIEAVAKALLDKKKLSGKEVSEIVESNRYSI